MLKVNNLPKYALDYKFVVCRVCNEEPWFWGAYNDEKTAFKVSTDINGIVVASSLIIID